MKNLSAKFSTLLSSKKFMMILSFLGLYLLSTGTSWAIFSYLKSEPDLVSDGSDPRSRIAEMAKTEECPINGGMFTEVEKDIWEDRRPIAAIIENHEESRPPSGITRADVVYEAVAEGGITRFLAIFYCGAAAIDVKMAPVRSARVYYVNWAQEYGDMPIFMHVGGANDYAGYGDTVRQARALELLESLGWRRAGGNDFDTTYDSGFPVFWRNYERLERPVATEHTMMASLDAAYKEAEKRGFTNVGPEGEDWDENFVSWQFSEDASVGSPDATEISFEFWSERPEYEVTWKYNKETNSYLRENGGVDHKDLASDQQISAKNVVVMLVRERGPVDRNLHILYTTVGKGSALIFANGTVVEGTWKKDSEEARTKFYDDSGKEIRLVGGTTWIEIVPFGNVVEYN